MADLVDTTVQAGNFEQLMNALTATELVELLRSPGPFTVLAPTDAAFAQLPEKTLNSLLLNLPNLKRVLMYHILPGDVRSDDLAEIAEAPTEEGSIVAVAKTNGTTKINDAQVLQTDILADNGVIHAIDTVLIPGVLEDNL